MAAQQKPLLPRAHVGSRHSSDLDRRTAGRAATPVEGLGDIQFGAFGKSRSHGDAARPTGCRGALDDELVAGEVSERRHQRCPSIYDGWRLAIVGLGFGDLIHRRCSGANN
jgi:hypothetical protein